MYARMCVHAAVDACIHTQRMEIKLQIHCLILLFIQQANSLAFSYVLNDVSSSMTAMLPLLPMEWGVLGTVIAASFYLFSQPVLTATLYEGCSCFHFILGGTEAQRS